MRKRKPHSALYWKLRRFFFSLRRPIDRFRARHLSIEAPTYLTAIIRDYLRAYTKISYSIGNAYYLEKYHKNMWELTEEEEAEESGNEEFEHFRTKPVYIPLIPSEKMP